MIPKIVHYCWFGEKEIPKRLKKCIESWSLYLPDYKIILWNETNFDIKSNYWTREAYERGKYAFVSDYVRLKVLYDYGGIYLDTDVMVKRNLDSFLKYRAFTGFESENKLTSAVIGSEKGFSLIKEYLETYSNRHFVNTDGSINDGANVNMMTDICKKYGFKANNSYQVIKEMHIFPRDFFCPIDFWRNDKITKNTFTIHYFEASWLDLETKKRIKRERSHFYKIFNKYISKLSKIYNKHSK